MKEMPVELRTKHKDFALLTNELLQRGVPVRFSAYGESMYPFIRSGEVITVVPAHGANDIRTGDVVLCWTSKRLFAHRVVGRKKVLDQDVLLTKGDSGAHVDEILREEVLGKVIDVERSGKYLENDPNIAQLKNLFVSQVSPIGCWLYPRIKKVKEQLKQVGLGIFKEEN